MPALVKDRVCSSHKLFFDLTGSQIPARTSIEIPIKSREIAAGNFQSKHMPLFEEIACRPNINREFVNLPGVDQRGRFLRIPEAGAKNAFRQVLREAVGPDVNQLGGEIGIDSRRCCV